MLNALLEGLIGGVGFMCATLVLFHIDDVVSTAVENRRKAKAAQARRKRRH